MIKFRFERWFVEFEAFLMWNGDIVDRFLPRHAVAILIFAVGLTNVAAVRGASLHPSASSLSKQNQQARAHDFTYLRDGNQVARFVDNGWLVPLKPSADFRLHDVSYPYARPEVRTFVERLSRQYRQACGEQLVITSATRPRNFQLRNASTKSVHPTGMAIDIRMSTNRSCRVWLEDTLLYLEKRRLLEAARERRPPHYHVVVFPRAYGQYVAKRESRRHTVQRGESLWLIAREHDVTVRELKHTNGLSSSRIYPGQVLALP